MDSEENNIPLELEENLVQTVEHVIRRKGFPSMNLCNILFAISMTVEMKPKFKRTITDCRWIDGFQKRWAHKLSGVARKGCRDIEPFAAQSGIEMPMDSTSHAHGRTSKGRFEILRERQGYARSTPSYSELHGSAGSPLHFTVKVPEKYNGRQRYQRSLSQQRKRRKMVNYNSDSSDIDSSDHYESSSDDTDSTDTSLSSQQASNQDKLIESTNDEEASDTMEDWDNKIRRVAMGLRKKVKPVDRFQIPSRDEKKRRKSTSPRKNFKPNSIVISSDDESLTSDKETMSSPAEDVEGESSKPQKNFDRVRSGKIKLDDMCLTCGTTKEIDGKHPLFNGGLCKEHKKLFHEWFFKYDSDGYHSYCSVCCMGKTVVLCDIQDCGRCYCKECLDSLVHEGCFEQATNSEHWVCNFCTTSPKGLLTKRSEWQEEIQAMYKNSGESQFPLFPIPPPIPVNERRGIRVLSLFDGISTGLVALKQLGLKIEKVVASEIDEDAIRLVQNKHPEVIHVGDITKLTDDELYNMGPFDILLGGSPCNDLSGANPRRRGLLDAEGSGCLFFDFYRVLKTIEPPRDENGCRHKRPFFWLFENVVSMKGIEKQRISRFLQCEPKMADARFVSAAARPRLFWGNIPGLKDRVITPGVKDRLKVQDCLEPGREAQVEKLNTITTKYTCLYQGQSRKAPVAHNGKEDVLWTTEVERIFGVPEHYTDVNNLGPRERLALLGRSWSVPVIRLLLSPLKEYFSGIQPSNTKEKLPNETWWN